MTTEAEAAGAEEAALAWEALARAAEAAPDGTADAAVTALICAANGSKPGRTCAAARAGPLFEEVVEVLNASGRVVWIGRRTACPDLSAEAALGLLESLLPGWGHAVHEDQADGSAEVELQGSGAPVRAAGRTIALGFTAALCRAMARQVRAASSASRAP